MIKIICVGKLKESFWREACSEYQKRLQKYTKLEIIEVPDQDYPPEIALEKESQDILRHLTDRDYVMILDIAGTAMTSTEFAKELDRDQMIHPQVVLIIGGSYGLHQKVKERSNRALSFSPMTFPHQLFRVMLLEQIYRCFKIIHHESYHK